jgi:pimeloyl-ACP methyl ester carboxylesterase
MTLPGHGPGEEPEFGLEDYVEALSEAVWAPEKTILVGHSMGGWVVLKYLERFKVAASVLVAPLPYNGLPFRLVRALAGKLPGAAFKTLIWGSPAQMVKAQVIKKLCFTEQTGDDVVARYVGRLVPESARAVRQMALMRTRLPGPARVGARRLKKMQKGRPHLIVASEADRFVTPGDLGATARLLGAEMLWLKDKPHALVETDEDRSVARAVGAWLEKNIPLEAA